MQHWAASILRFAMQQCTKYSCKKQQVSLFVSCYNKLSLNTCIFFSKVGVGSAIPNGTTKVADRGEAKIANADPDLLKKFSNWNEMKKESSRLLAGKKDQWVRNFETRKTLQTVMYNTLRDDAALMEIWEMFRDSCNAQIDFQARYADEEWKSGIYREYFKNVSLVFLHQSQCLK